MKKIIRLIELSIIFLTVWSTNAQEITTHREMAEELLNLMNVKKNIEKSFMLIRKMTAVQMEKMKKRARKTETQSEVTNRSDRIMELMLQEFSWDKIKTDYITLYAETFSKDEMKGIISFYKSPAGKAFINKQPDLLKRSMELNQQKIMQIIPKIKAMTENKQETLSSSDNPKTEENPLEKNENVKAVLND